jgi:hypothetical protein
MDIPDDPNLPFFTYGLFRPGQIGFNSLRSLIRRSEPNWTIEAQLLERDGLPLLDTGCNQVEGWLLRFLPESGVAAYSAINTIEPGRLYVWRTCEIRRQGKTERANVLFGRRPRKGSSYPEYKVWEGEKEPLFTVALDVIQKSLDRSRQFEWNLEPFFQLQMAYMLLWSGIERFASFKYHLGGNATAKILELADDPVFAKALRERVTKRREVYRSDDPEQKEVLSVEEPGKALKYYYQIRSNIIHRGKSAVRDHDILRASLEELLEIFKIILKAEFSTTTHASTEVQLSQNSTLSSDAGGNL